MEKKRQRKANFSEKEVKILLEEINIKSTMLFSSISASVTQQKKNESWTAITNKVNSVGVALRSAQECRDKWKNLKGVVLNRQREARKTGGGPPAPPAPFEELIIGIIGQNSSLISGIQRVEASAVVYGHSVKFAQSLGPTTDCSHLTDDNSCTSFIQPVAHQPKPADDEVCQFRLDQSDNGSVILTDLSTSVSFTPSACGQEKKSKPKKTSGKRVIDAAGHDDLVEEWLRSEIKKNHAIETHLEKKNKKIDLQIRKLELELGNASETDPTHDRKIDYMD